MSVVETGKRRVLYVDWARGLAISLALFSHAMLGVAGWEALSAQYPALYGMRLITRAATPTFILLFGVSLEFAYVRRWSQSGKLVRNRLLKRAAKCYGAVIVLAAAAFVGGSMTGPEVLLSAVFATPVLNGAIFVFYAVAMLCAMLLVPLRRHIGIFPTLGLALLWWPIAGTLGRYNPADPRVDSVTSRVLGIGDELGPSVLHAMPVVVVGMALGQWIRRPSERAARRDAIVSASLVFGGALAAAALDGPIIAATSFVHDYRATNHFGYYSIGAAAGLIILAICRKVETSTTLISRRGPGAFGGHSLQAFMLGNVGINVFSGQIRPGSALVSVAFAAAYVLAFWFLLRVWRRYRDGSLEIRRVPVAG